MPAYVVLLRGVNVGRAKRVPMADFRQLLLSLGCTQATTVLNSGNAVVTHARVAPAALARRVAEALAQHFGFDVPVVIKSAAEFTAVVSGCRLALAEADPARLLVVLAQDAKAVAALAGLSALLVPPEALQVEERLAAYLYCARGILDSAAAKALLAGLDQAMTTRNWATVNKLQALVDQGLP